MRAHQRRSVLIKSQIASRPDRGGDSTDPISRRSARFTFASCNVAPKDPGSSGNPLALEEDKPHRRIVGTAIEPALGNPRSRKIRAAESAHQLIASDYSMSATPSYISGNIVILSMRNSIGNVGTSFNKRESEPKRIPQSRMICQTSRSPSAFALRCATVSPSGTSRV